MKKKINKLSLEIVYSSGSKGVLLPITVQNALEDYFMAGGHKFRVREIIVPNENYCPFCNGKFEKDKGTGLVSHTNSKKKCEIKSIMFTKTRSKIRYGKVRE